MNLATKFILTACILCITFVAGYLSGSKVEGDSRINSLAGAEDTATTAPNTPPISNDAALESNKNKVSTSVPNNTLSALAPNQAGDNKNQDTLVTGPAEYDIVALFNDFVAYAGSGSDYSDYGKKIDGIRKLLISSSADLALLLEHFEELPIDSQESYMLISILMGLPTETSQPAMLKIMQTTLINDDPNNAANFIELAARTGLKSPEITNSLKNIAIFGAQNDLTLRALDMLMPYELSSTENQQIKERLQGAIDSSDSSETPYYFSQLLRFSSANERKQLALDAFNQNDPNNGIQSIIMDSIQMGTLDRTSELKEAIYRIAKQDQNELQKQAIYTLLYRFDLSQEEYKDISAGQDLQQNNIYDVVH